MLGKRIKKYLEIVHIYDLGSLVEAEKVIREVWKRQDSGQRDLGWGNVLRDCEMRFILT
jgi:arginine metabolism regulation protein II